MPAADVQATLGSPARVVDLVIDLVSRRHFRQARMQLVTHEARHGLSAVAELVNRITAPPAGVDPRTEAQARLNVPDLVPAWLAAPLRDEISRVCARQAMRAATVPHVIARVLAASIVDESAPATDELGSFAVRAHVDLREVAAGETSEDVAPVVDVTGEEGAGSDAGERPDRSLTDWLGRRR